MTVDTLPPPVPGRSLVHRVVSLIALLAVELVAISVWLDTAALERATGLLGLVGTWGPSGLLLLVASGGAFIALAYVAGRRELERISRIIAPAPISVRWLAVHLAVLVASLGAAGVLFAETPSSASRDLLTAVWLIFGAGAAACAAAAFVPFGVWRDIARGTRAVWMYAAAAAGASYLLKGAAEALWKPSSDLAFALVTMSLRPLVPDLVANPGTFTITSRNFSVIISKECSGLEGAGLMLVFGTLWLWFLRREYRFPHALLLVPAGVVLMWFANVARIDILFLIGSAGLRKVAAGGFHSQAGWIAFNAVALGFTAASRHARWLNKGVASPAVLNRHDNPVAPYLMPLLAILAASMVSGAVSGGFEWLYPLRFFAAAAVLWHFRSRYKDLNWHVGWLAPVAGIIVFMMWLTLDRLVDVTADNGIAVGLASLPVAARVLWLVFRTLGAVVTVPIAEELAFRGFLMRRLISSDFTSVDFRRFDLVAVLISSVVFGALHGDRVVAGTVAGLIYAGTALWRGRIGDAVVAHATTNALIAASVLLGGQFQLW